MNLAETSAGVLAGYGNAPNIQQDVHLQKHLAVSTENSSFY